VIEAGQALEKARGYLEQFIPDFAALDPRVEEIALTPDSSTWRITLYAYKGDRSDAATLADLLRFRRIEKVISISAEDGALIGISNPVPASMAS